MIYAEKKRKAENPRKSPQNPTRKREENLKIRVTAKKLRFYGRLEREKRSERGGNTPAPIFITKKKPVRCPDRGRRHRSFYINKQSYIM